MRPPQLAVRYEAGERRHLDYGCALTSHRRQGQTAGRVLVDVETARTSEKLVNQRLAYVAVSRGQYDARIYTDDKVGLARALNRDVSHRSALERMPGQGSRQSERPEISRVVTAAGEPGTPDPPATAHVESPRRNLVESAVPDPSRAGAKIPDVTSAVA